MSMLLHTNYFSWLLRSFFIALCFICFSSKVFALGVSPSVLTVENVLSGGEARAEFNFSRSQVDNEMKFKLRALSAEGAYIQFPDGDILHFPVGVATVRIPVLIVPGRLATGRYETAILADPTPFVEDESGKKGSGSTIVSGVKARIQFSVSNDAIEAYTVADVNLGETEVGQPIGLSFTLMNKGNVDARPEFIQVDFVDVLNPKNTLNVKLDAQTFDYVKAFSIKDLFASLENQLKVGTYQSSIKVYNKKKELVFKDEVRLTVHPEGTLAQKGEIKELIIKKKLLTAGELAKFEATFLNIGSIGTEAAMILEIYKDGERIEVFKEAPVFIPRLKAKTWEFEYAPTEPGVYDVKAQASYSIYETELLEDSFELKGMPTVVIFGGFVALSLCVILGVFIWHRRKLVKKSPLPSSVPPVPLPPH